MPLGQIRNLVVEYISKPNRSVPILRLSNRRSVDSQGRRTIGVLTKLDLMDAGTEALDIPTGRVYPLKLGVIGIFNRSQQDINSKKEDPLG